MTDAAEGHDYRVLASESVFEGHVISLRRDTVAMPGGGDSVREVVSHPGAVAVVALDDEGSVPRLAHGLKGSSAALGATSLARVCHSLETVHPAGLAVGDTLAVLDRERSRVRAAVSALLAGVESSWSPT